MADSPIAGFFAELKLTVDQSSFRAGDASLDRLKEKLQDVAATAEKVGERINKVLGRFPKEINIKVNYKESSGGGDRGGGRQGFPGSEAGFTMRDPDGSDPSKALATLGRGWGYGRPRDVGRPEYEPAWPGGAGARSEFNEQLKIGGPSMRTVGSSSIANDGNEAQIRVKKKAEEDTTDRIKQQNKEYEKSSSHLKALIGLALAYKAAKAAVSAIVDQGGKMQGATVGAGLLGISPTEYMKLSRGMDLAGKMAISMDSILNMNQALAKMMTGDENKEKFLKSLAMLGIEPEGFLKGDVTSKITSLMTAGQRARSTGTPEQRQVATELMENILPGSAGLNEWLTSSKYKNIFGLLGASGGIGMTSDADIESGSRLNDEINGVSVRFNALIEKFVTSLGQSGLTGMLSGLNSWYDSEKGNIKAALDGFSRTISAIAKILNDFVLSPIGGAIIWTGQKLNEMAEEDERRKGTPSLIEKVWSFMDPAKVQTSVPSRVPFSPTPSKRDGLDIKFQLLDSNGRAIPGKVVSVTSNGSNVSTTVQNMVGR